jgi:insertion element IS1 protein InsB
MKCGHLWVTKETSSGFGLARDANTREMVGDRSEVGAQGLWESLPGVYRQCAVAYTDFWNTYALVFPSKRHQAVGKESGKTSYIERFNCTMRQRVSSLVRKTLSFSKKLEISMLFGCSFTTIPLLPFWDFARLCIVSANEKSTFSPSVTKEGYNASLHA